MTDADKPLHVIPQLEAVANLKANPAAYWRSTVGRVNNGHLRTWIAPKVLLGPDDPVYAIGSCFALELEKALLGRGHKVLSALSPDDPFLIRAYLARYNVPSMAREFERCLVDPCPMRDEDLAVALPDGSYRDGHYYALDRLRNMNALSNKRAAARKSFRRIREAKVVILTLGLNEVWYDPDAGAYLNTCVDLDLISAKPRLEVHVLSAAQNVRHLEAIRDLIRTHIPHPVQIIVSVSPVALSATFSMDDVVVANMRSKSILRAAAEEFCARHDDVHYFPSYEISMCSDLRETFQQDGRHVKPTMAQHIIRTFNAVHMGGLGMDAVEEAPLAATG
ncbi:GSCFA domain-containing protein [Oharaeibacter diazotrophicus]|uniref:GSCFA family protein n=1 Tax=Oharaeibacter diazotrophicus TaxID=1920512 RepID=A0A4R6RJH1_9HYPH|nr:GSCFA domain-containing protein [Oharaeibacter diazotrophicus]TDP86771.1 GSCFA family protein [Oharaeibacter diazotrophicus]BBE71286.1 GSCFA family protein [Pleomorphomonas sp. SM30]GLS78041.1 hypothetical protein GCM10007904_33780 [Oharaeibacter diazotrophicus]